MAKALEIAPKLNVPGTFKASCMWLKRWKQLGCGVPQMTLKGSLLIIGMYCSFRANFTHQRVKYNITLAQVFNMDQTMYRFDMVPTCTNVSIGRKSIQVVLSKPPRKDLLLLFVPIVQEFHKKVGNLAHVTKNITCAPNVLVTASTNGWMTSNLYHWWLSTRYGCITSLACRLLQDSHNNSELIFIPAGCMSLVQPMDVSVNRLYKQCKICGFSNLLPTHNAPVHGNPKTPSQQDVINWFSAAWDSIKTDTIRESFYSVASQLPQIVTRTTKCSAMSRT